MAGEESLHNEEIVLTMEGIQKSFGAVRAVTNGRLILRKGEVHALMGENGAGKSTLMNILSGSLKPDAGRIVYLGKETHISSPIEARALGISKIHQELQLVPELTVGENIFAGREPVNKLGFIDYSRMFSESSRLLEAFNLKISPKTPVKELRVGEQQLIEIAKATSLNAKIVIMDEPTSALSKNEAQKLFDVVSRLKREGVTIVYITHRIEEVFEITDRITVMRDGEFIAQVDTANTVKDELIKLMVGRTLASYEKSGFNASGEELLRVEGLSLKFHGASKKTGLNNISFSLRKGEILGIAGLMGSGRTELFECIFGLYPHGMTGRLYIRGKPVTIKRPEDAINNGIVYLTEDRKQQGLVLTRSIGENISLPILKRFSRWFFMNVKEERPLWEKQMSDIRIKATSCYTLARELSGGNQQKVVIGRWLLTDPDILLLDEPTRGIDVGSRGEIYNLISSLAAKGIGVLVVSSELPELLAICGRILTFCEGRLTGDFDRDKADQETLLHAATLREEGQQDGHKHIR